MAPGVNLREIGIRPGEKLHEVMVTEDDARTTVEYPDRYIIEPSFCWKKSFKSGAKPVLEGLRRKWYKLMTHSDEESLSSIYNLPRQKRLMSSWEYLQASSGPKIGGGHVSRCRVWHHLEFQGCDVDFSPLVTIDFVPDLLKENRYLDL